MLHVQDSPYIKTIHYENADDFIKAISYKGKLYELFDKHYIFRGHSTDKYILLPTALRGNLVLENTINFESLSDEEQGKLAILSETELGQIQQEYKLLQDFFWSCDTCGLYIPHIESLRNSFIPGIDVKQLILASKWLPRKYWELAALAQHHSVKTRLLDWTHDINVALYFATKGVYYDPKEKIDTFKRIKAFRKGDINPPKHNMEIWALDIGVVMVKPNEVPLHIIQPCYYKNVNLNAQKGVLTFWDAFYPGLPDKNVKPDFGLIVDRKSLDKKLDSYLREIKAKERTYLYQITIPQDAASDIYSHIEKMGYNASTIFPGYDGVAKYLKEHLEIHKKGKKSAN